MRVNLPVTSTEYQLSDGESIVSKTDLHGNIVYVNPYFVEVSGFTEQELIGQPQNIVRHPDMPVEAFADLWATLKTGLPWNGMVKNRCKNGDFYWVLANVTPVREAGKPVGYMSVRTAPSRAQISAAEKMYRQFKNGDAKGLAITHGALVKTNIFGKIAALSDMSLRLRIGLIMSFLIMLILGLGVAGFSASGQRVPGSEYWIAGATAAGVAMAVYGWYSLLSSVVVPIKLATSVARAIAGGDLSSRFASDRADDTGQLLRALQQMNVNLMAIIGDVRSNVESIHVATKEIAVGNMDLSGRTESQASSLEETAASMEEFGSTVKQNAEHAVQANQLAASASAVAVKGGDVVAQVIVTMEEISTSARKIVDIISLIDGIAFQTNILALNAAVEAARAGEQGRGFAVVASEVRHLAQRSASAAKEIKGLIDVSVDKVALGTKLVHQAGVTMDEVVNSVQRVTSIMSEISSASSEQSAGINQVNIAVMQMDEVTQQNAALVEQAAAAAASLEEQAVKLEQAVSVFKLRGKPAPGRSATRTSQIRSPATRPAASNRLQIAAGKPEWEDF